MNLGEWWKTPRTHKKKRKRRMSNNVEKKKTPATLNDEVKTKRMQPQKRREYLSCQR